MMLPYAVVVSIVWILVRIGVGLVELFPALRALIAIRVIGTAVAINTNTQLALTGFAHQVQPAVDRQAFFHALPGDRFATRCFFRERQIAKSRQQSEAFVTLPRSRGWMLSFVSLR
jgi:hypothetical protein